MSIFSGSTPTGRFRQRCRWCSRAKKNPPVSAVAACLHVVRYEVEVLCTADNIPPELTLQPAGLERRSGAHASSAALPDGVEFTTLQTATSPRG